MNKYFEKVRDCVEDSIIPDLALSLAKQFIIGYYEFSKVVLAMGAFLLLVDKKYLLASAIIFGLSGCPMIEKDLAENWEI